MEQPNLSPGADEMILPTSTLAIVSLVSALLGFTFVPVAGGIVALVTGYLARSETRASPPKAAGDGMATAGIVMGWIQMGLLVLGICCVLAYAVFVLGWFATSNR